MSAKIRLMGKAHHEAGHAVAALAHGAPLLHISINPSVCKIKEGWEEMSPGNTRVGLTIALSGPAAEYLYWSKLDPDSLDMEDRLQKNIFDADPRAGLSTEDAEMTDRWANRLNLSPDQIALAWREAMWFLSLTTMRALVQQLASELVSHGEVSGERAQDLAARHA